MFNNKDKQIEKYIDDIYDKLRIYCYYPYNSMSVKMKYEKIIGAINESIIEFNRIKDENSNMEFRLMYIDYIYNFKQIKKVLENLYNRLDGMNCVYILENIKRIYDKEINRHKFKLNSILGEFDSYLSLEYEYKTAELKASAFMERINISIADIEKSINHYENLLTEIEWR